MSIEEYFLAIFKHNLWLSDTELTKRAIGEGVDETELEGLVISWVFVDFISICLYTDGRQYRRIYFKRSTVPFITETL